MLRATECLPAAHLELRPIPTPTRAVFAVVRTVLTEPSGSLLGAQTVVQNFSTQLLMVLKSGNSTYLRLPNFRCVTTWVISKVLHTVRFLFKNEFILQNTFTGLQYNLHCALSRRSNVWASLVFLSGRLRC
jgi:hypothetical protein